MAKSRRTPSLILGCLLLGGSVMAPLAVTGVLSSSAAGASSSSAGSIALGMAANAPIMQTPTAPGTYMVSITVNTTRTAINYSGTLTILPTGSFSSNLTTTRGSTQCSGIWTTSGNYIAMEISGTTAGPNECLIPEVDWVLAGHLYGKGIKSGTLNQWFTDANGVPTTAAFTGTWNAVKK